MSLLSASIGGTRRLVAGLGQYGLLLGPVRRAIVEPAAAMSDEVLRLLLCHYGRRCWEQGLIAGVAGNLSARARSRDAIYITPRAVNKAWLSHAEICRVPLDPAPEDLADVSSEFPMHRACYVAADVVGSVIHTHAPALTAVGIRGIDMAEYLPESTDALGGVRRLPYAPPGSDALGDVVGAAAAEGARLFLLERHGVVSVGRNLSDAYDRMEFAELTARAVLLALGGAPCA